jgi:hypothetical protein
MSENFHIDRAAWAVSLFEGARRMVAAEPNVDIRKISVPFYLLIGFSIENGLKSVIDDGGRLQGKLRLSHDLDDLLDVALDCGFAASAEVQKFIRELATDHAKFTFRYPEKAGWVSLYKPEYALRVQEAFLISVVHSKKPADLDGWQPRTDFWNGPRSSGSS